LALGDKTKSSVTCPKDFCEKNVPKSPDGSQGKFNEIVRFRQSVWAGPQNIPGFLNLYLIDPAFLGG
jgi:hypothetical protein